MSQFDSNKNRYKILIENVRRVEKFELLDCFDDYEFHPFGIYGKNENGIKRYYQPNVKRRRARCSEIAMLYL